MFALRYLYVVALVLWVGGLVVAGALVAPSAFGVLQSWNESQGRVLAGQVFGEVLLRLTWLSYAMGAVMFITLTLRRLRCAQPVEHRIRVATTALMLLLMTLTGFYLIREVDSIHAQVSGPVSEQPDTDPRRVEFNRLHGLSNILFPITGIGGLALCWCEARE